MMTCQLHSLRRSTKRTFHQIATTISFWPTSPRRSGFEFTLHPKVENIMGPTTYGFGVGRVFFSFSCFGPPCVAFHHGYLDVMNVFVGVLRDDKLISLQTLCPGPLVKVGNIIIYVLNALPHHSKRSVVAALTVLCQCDPMRL